MPNAPILAGIQSGLDLTDLVHAVITNVTPYV